MKWLNGSDKGMELVYRRGYNDNKMLLKTRVLWKEYTVLLEPTSERALKGNRHVRISLKNVQNIQFLLKNIKNRL